ncbi:hypothetical protein C8Q78DRAFT_803116 [Trametes maxima]|nr:hypothetical protein C8Q78DRAFT_803116 [Trametes maxima]
MTVHIFLTGAMGFIGGGVLGTLYPLIQENKYTVTALVRSEAKASPFHKYAIDTVIGTLDDFATIEQETAKADAVIHTASDEHIPDSPLDHKISHSRYHCWCEETSRLRRQQTHFDSYLGMWFRDRRQIRDI